MTRRTNYLEETAIPLAVQSYRNRIQEYRTLLQRYPAGRDNILRSLVDELNDISKETHITPYHPGEDEEEIFQNAEGIAEELPAALRGFY